MKNCNTISLQLSSILHQNSLNPSVDDIIEQNKTLHKLKVLGTTIKYIRRTVRKKHKLSFTLYFDDAENNERDQIGNSVGLLIYHISKELVFLIVSYASHRSKRPTRGEPTEEILAASKDIFTGNEVEKAYAELLRIN